MMAVLTRQTKAFETSIPNLRLTANSVAGPVTMTMTRTATTTGSTFVQTVSPRNSSLRAVATLTNRTRMVMVFQTVMMPALSVHSF